MSKDTEWAQEFFSDLAVKFWLKSPTEELTREETDFLVKELRLPAGGRVLDVACGGGRHSCELAARGYRATGVDASTAFLDSARALAKQKKVDVTWEQRDMTDLPWPGVFDGVFCWGNGFGYYDDEANLRCLQAMADALRPGGRFVLNFGTVAESLFPVLQERIWYPFGDSHFMREGHYNPVLARMESVYYFIEGDRIEKKQLRQRVYGFRELCRLVQDCGMTDVTGYGSKTGEPYRLRSPELYLTATRKDKL
jgi:SAM-dependent methyltransferase